MSAARPSRSRGWRASDCTRTVCATARLSILKSGVDPLTIAHWLGHASVNTTNRYATIDLDMKRRALAKAQPLSTPRRPAWRRDATILGWLEAL